MAFILGASISPRPDDDSIVAPASRPELIARRHRTGRGVGARAGRRSNLPRVSFVSLGESANVALAFANPLNVKRLLGCRYRD